RWPGRRFREIATRLPGRAVLCALACADHVAVFLARSVADRRVEHGRVAGSQGGHHFTASEQPASRRLGHDGPARTNPGVWLPGLADAAAVRSHQAAPRRWRLDAAWVGELGPA